MSKLNRLAAASHTWTIRLGTGPGRVLSGKGRGSLIAQLNSHITPSSLEQIPKQKTVTLGQAFSWNFSAPVSAVMRDGEIFNKATVSALHRRADNRKCPRVSRNPRQSPWQSRASEEEEKVSRRVDPFPHNNPMLCWFMAT